MPRRKPKSGTLTGKRLEAKRSEAVAKDPNYLPFDNNAPLLPIEGETAKANKALNDYAALGVARSREKLLAMYERMSAEYLLYVGDPKRWERDHPKMTVPLEPPTTAVLTVSNWSRDCLWMERVARYDAILNEVQRLEFETDRRMLKEKRIEILKMSLTRLQAALAQLRPQDATWSEVTNGIRRINQELRIEMGDDVGDPGTGSGHARLLVVKLPAGVSGVAIEDDDDLDDDDDE